MKNLVRTLLFLCVAFVFAAQNPPTDKHKIKSLKTNTSHSDYAVAFLPNDKVVFVSSTNNSPSTPIDLFFGDINKEGEITNKRPLSGVSQNKNISKTGITFSKDFKRVYFSARENRKKSKRKKANDRIFVADVDAKGNWKNIKKLPFNNDKYISKQPVLSNDGKKLYFVSNRPSTIGETDIFVVAINSDGTYGEPKNLGETINTKGEEVTPFISVDNKLYFSSDGRDDTLGGLDVYVSQLDNNGIASEPRHLDVSINRAHDEFAYITYNGKGYFSSNDKDNFNMYAFTVDRKETTEDVLVDSGEENRELTREEKQEQNRVRVAEKQASKQALLEDKKVKALSQKEELKARKEAESERILAEREATKLNNAKEVAEREQRKEAEITAKKEAAKASIAAVKAKEKLEEEQTIARREATQKENEERVAQKEAAKAAEIKDKAAQTVALKEEIKRNKQSEKEQAIAAKQELKAQRLQVREQAIAAREAKVAAKKAKAAATKEKVAARQKLKEEKANTRKEIAARIEKENATKKALALSQTAKEKEAAKQQVAEVQVEEEKQQVTETQELVSTNETKVAVQENEISTPTNGEEKVNIATNKYHIKYLEMNTAKSDYAVGYYNENVVFTTPIDAESKKSTNDLFIGQIDEGREIINKADLKGIARNKNISKTGVTYSSDSKQVYFSAKKTKKKAKDQLFTATIDAQGNWVNVKKLPFNGKKYTTSQPTLSVDGKKLYFVSDRPGSYGGTDIYVVDVKTDGTYGEPTNVGDKINTNRDEVTPHITKDNVLYFSSNGQATSQGGLDIYSSQIINNSASELNHLEAPINGINNDFAYIKNGDRGYFSSNRLQGQDNNDIYSYILIEEKPKKCLQEIAGIVKDNETELALYDAAITLFDEEGNQLKQVRTDNEGKYKLTLDCNKTYTLIASNMQYVKEEHIINTANYLDAPALTANKFLVKKLPGEPEDIVAVTGLVKNTEEVVTTKDKVEATEAETTKETVVEATETTEDKTNVKAAETVVETTTTNEILNLNSVVVHYDFDSSEIRTDDTYELDRIVTMMKESTSIKIQVNAYTDARGSSVYNLALSSRRANAAIDYIISQGISRSRLIAKGFGETQMVNQCVNGVACSEAAHQMNRRTEFVILN